MAEAEVVALLDGVMDCWYLTWNVEGDVFASSDKRDQAWEAMPLAEARRRGLARPVRR